jgi:hypothetical protein
LLAVRNTVDGEYWPRHTLEGTGLPVVGIGTDGFRTADGLVSFARALLGYEGFVVRFDDGLWLKIKADDYVMKHKAKDSILQEKNVLALVLSGGLDDVLPLLDESDASDARAYRDGVESGIAQTVETLRLFVAANDNVPQKEYALDKVPTLPPHLRSLAFMARKTDAREAVRAALVASTSSQTRVDEHRALHGATWNKEPA